MKGLMMDYPLTVTSLMRHVEAQHGGSEVYSLTVDNPAHRTTYAGIFRRSAKLANALGRLGLKQGDRVATMAWNDYRHMELYYGISCMGGVLHTINPRLFPEQLQYIVNHAEDRFLFSIPCCSRCWKSCTWPFRPWKPMSCFARRRPCPYHRCRT